MILVNKEKYIFMAFKSITKTIMFRYLILCCFLTKILTTDAQDFGQIFSDNGNAGLPQCQTISGTGSGCYECYPCGSGEANLQNRKLRTSTNLTIFDNKCNGTKVCCYSQSEYISRTFSSHCGIINPQGEPRRVRDSLKSVLPGEYPWRTWIYSVSRPDEPICGGVFVDKSTQSIITLARCVKDFDKEDLEVKFSKSKAGLNVADMILHPFYDEEQGINDIAVLTLANGSNLPEWASVACLSNFPPRLPTACIAISDNDKYINTIIPLQKLCFNQSDSVHESQMCAVTSWNDYEPELGGGLFCDTNLIKTKYQYAVHGIIAYKHKYNKYVYTSVTQYFDWLENIFENKN